MSSEVEIANALSDLRDDEAWAVLERDGTAGQILAEASLASQGTLTQAGLEAREIEIMHRLGDIDFEEALRRELITLRRKRGAHAFLRLVQKRQGFAKTAEAKTLRAAISRHRNESADAGDDPAGYDDTLWGYLAAA